MLTKKDLMAGIMTNSGIWSDVNYTVTVDNIEVRAIIPQGRKALCRDKVTGAKVLKKEVAYLLRHPSAENKMILRAKYGVTVSYTPANSTFVNYEGKEAA